MIRKFMALRHVTIPTTMILKRVTGPVINWSGRIIIRSVLSVLRNGIKITFWRLLGVRVMRAVTVLILLLRRSG